jgi:hypothetical protein
VRNEIFTAYTKLGQLHLYSSDDLENWGVIRIQSNRITYYHLPTYIREKRPKNGAAMHKHISLPANNGSYAYLSTQSFIDLIITSFNLTHFKRNSWPFCANMPANNGSIPIMPCIASGCNPSVLPQKILGFIINGMITGPLIYCAIRKLTPPPVPSDSRCNV